MNAETQAISFIAIPLLVLGALYLLTAATLAPQAWRDRRRARGVELAPALGFPAGGVAATLFGLAVLLDPGAAPGATWLAFAAIVVAAVPPLVYFARFGDRGLLLSGPRAAREVEALRTETERRRAVTDAFTTELGRAVDEEAVGALLAGTASRLLGADFASLVVVEGGFARGVAALLDGRPVEWWPELRLDLGREPSAIASAVFEAAPLTVFDADSSAAVHRGLADRLGVRSAVFVPVVAGESVIGVLSAATTRAPRAFDTDDVRVLQELAAESALALERSRSSVALARALERERLVARISQRVRSELDPNAVLRIAVEETPAALEADRCLVRLGEPGGPMAVAAEWHRPGLEPVGGAGLRLPASNRAAAERRTVSVPDLRAEGADGAEVAAAAGVRAALATPAVAFDEVIGVLALHRVEPHEWSTDEVALAEAVAHEVALTLHTARLLAENARRLEQQTALLKAGRALASELDLDAVIQRLVEEVVNVVGGDAADCWLFEEDGRTLRCRAVRGLPKGQAGRRIPAEGTIGEAIATGRPVLKRDFAASEQPEPSPAYRGFAEVMDAPIVGRDGVRGVLGVCALEAGAFDGDHLALLEAFAGLASLAVRNAEAFAESARQARVERSFYRIASMLAEPLSLEATLGAVAQAAGDALGGSAAALLLARGDRLAFAAAESLPPALEQALAEGLAGDDAALHEAAREQRLLASSDVAGDERFGAAWRAVAAQSACRALLAVPVQSGRDPAGFGLVLVFFPDAREFREEDLELAHHLGGAARGALERSALYEEERSARSLAQQLARTGSLLATELDPEAVLDEVVRQAPVLAGVEACAIRVVEAGELVVTAASGLPADVVGGRSPGTGWLSGEVAQSRAPLAHEDVHDDARLRAADPVLELGFRAYLGVPLSAPEGALHGVLSLYARAPKAWRPDEVEALVALAANASAALSNAELYQRVALEKERSFAILANIADGIVALDREGRVVLWNNAAEEITRVPAREALGRTPFEVLGRRLEAEPGVEGRDRVVSILRGGEQVSLSLTEAVMRDPAGAVAGRIYAFRDVSADLLVEQMKTEFVSTVSQELRRPLTSIYGFAETLLRRDVLFGEEERRTFLGYIASESERLTTIVDQLLNVARLDGGDLQIALQPTDVAAAVNDTIAEARASADGHRFVAELPDEPLAAAADPEKLRLVLANLIDNAVKYSPEGGTVTVTARRRRERVEVSVEDEGIGIPQGEQRRIFRKFYRAESGGVRDSGAGGTGVGLFIVQGLVAAMGGRIWVESAEGKGSSFTFELGLARARSEHADQRVGRELHRT